MVKFENKVFICHCSRLSLSLHSLCRAGRDLMGQRIGRHVEKATKEPKVISGNYV